MVGLSGKGGAWIPFAKNKAAHSTISSSIQACHTYGTLTALFCSCNIYWPCPIFEAVNICLICKGAQVCFMTMRGCLDDLQPFTHNRWWTSYGRLQPLLTLPALSGWRP
eukprot:1149413-Pelagomonas_calceolata.AAC.8